MDETPKGPVTKPGFEAVVENTLKDVPLKLVMGITALFSTVVPYAFSQVAQTLDVLLGIHDIDEAAFVAAFFFIYFLLPLLYIVLRAGRVSLGSIWTLLALVAAGLFLLIQAGNNTPPGIHNLFFGLALLGWAFLLYRMRHVRLPTPLGVAMFLLLGAGLAAMMLGDFDPSNPADRDRYRLVLGLFLAATGGLLLFVEGFRTEASGRTRAALTVFALTLFFIGLSVLAPSGTHLSISIAATLVVLALAYGAWFLFRARQPNPNPVPGPIRALLDGGKGIGPLVLLLGVAAVVLLVDIAPISNRLLDDFGSRRARQDEVGTIKTVRQQRDAVDALLRDLQTRRSRIAAWAAPPDSLGLSSDSVTTLLAQELLPDTSTFVDSVLTPHLRTQPGSSARWNVLLRDLALQDRRVLEARARGGLGTANDTLRRALDDWAVGEQVAGVYLEGQVREHLRMEQELAVLYEGLAARHARLHTQIRARQADVLRGIQRVGSWLFLLFALGLLALWGYTSWNKTRIRQDLINLFFFGAALHLLLLVPLLQEIRADQIDIEHPLDTVLMSNWFFPRFLERNIIEPIQGEPVDSGTLGAGGRGGGTVGPAATPPVTDLEPVLERITRVDSLVSELLAAVPDTHVINLDPSSVALSVDSVDIDGIRRSLTTIQRTISRIDTAVGNRILGDQAPAGAGSTPQP